MSYYVRENGVVVKKEGPNPEAQHIKSYYRPGDMNVYHYELTPEEQAYLSKQSRLEKEYNRVNYFNAATGKENDILIKAKFLDDEPIKIFYRKWGYENNIHWCTSRSSLWRGELKFIGSSDQEFIMKDYGTYWALSKEDFVPLPTGRTKYYINPHRYRYY